MVALAATCAAGAVAIVPALGGSAGAQPGTVRVVADHLNNPRGLDFGPNGALYVAEAGRAGNTCPRPDECFGFTSALTRINVDQGTKTRVVGHLPSFGGGDGSFAVGLDDVGVSAGGRIFGPMTTISPDDLRFLPARARRLLGRLLRFSGGEAHPAGNIAAFEAANDPDRQGIESNPYGVEAARHGLRYVADAAGNTLLRVRRGRVSLVAVTPDVSNNADFVPTCVTIGEDGALFVGGLAGDAAPPNGAKVLRVVPGERPTIYARNLNAVVGCALGRDGTLYVTELSRHGFRGDGAVAVIPPGRHQPSVRLGVGDLNFPAGVAVGPSGDKLYVSNWSVLPGKTQRGGPFAGGRGQVVSVELP